jgi:hypothetical protein
VGFEVFVPQIPARPWTGGVVSLSGHPLGIYVGQSLGGWANVVNYWADTTPLPANEELVWFNVALDAASYMTGTFVPN